MGQCRIAATRWTVLKQTSFSCQLSSKTPKTHLLKSAYNQKTHLPTRVCVCTHVCVCVCVCVCLCMRVHVCTQYATVHFLVCSISTYYIYVYLDQSWLQYMCLYYICVHAQIRVLSCLCLFTETAVCKFLHGLTVTYGQKPFYFVHHICLYIFCIFLYGVLCFRFLWGSCALEMSVINPFTAPACKISGLKSAHIHAHKQYILWSYNKSTLSTVNSDRNPFT